MAERAITPTPKTYAELRDAVEATLIRGQREIDRAKLETYWRTGALINRYLADHEEDTGHGTDTMRRLARDLNYETSVLYRCLRFARTYPNFAGRRNLLWAHYRVLIDVADAAKRRALELDADRKHWTADQLETEIRALNAIDVTPEKDGSDSVKPVELLKPRRGTPGLHLIVDRGDGPEVDLGFMIYRDLTSDQEKRLAKGDIVRLNESGVRKIDDATKAELFTYAAIIRRVIDGDTLVAKITVAPGISRELKLRLGGLDCAEMSTAAGRAAKLFVDGLIKPGDEVIISTTKPDKFDRYLANVFLRPAVSDKLKAESLGPTAEIFLNNALLEAGHAVRYDGGAKEE